MAFTNFAIDRKSKEYFWSMAYRPLLIVCWYLPAGVYQFFKQPLLLTSLTTSPYWFWRLDDVSDLRGLHFWKIRKKLSWWDTGELVYVFSCLLSEQSSHQIILHVIYKSLCCNGLPAVSGSRHNSIRCCNSLLPTVLINKPASSW